MTPVAVHPEGPRYVRSLVFLPGLWATAKSMMPLASHLAHRGWAGLVLDAEGRGGVTARAAEVARQIASTGTPPVLVAHDAAGAVAIEAARRAEVAGIVWLAPIGPRRAEVLRRLGAWRLALAILTGRVVARPATRLEPLLFGDIPSATLAEYEAAPFVSDALRRGGAARPEGGSLPDGVPLLILASECDGGHVVGIPRAESDLVAVRGPSLLGPSAAQQVGGTVHRWLVRRLGAENLELYEEAMADREDADG